MSTPQTEPATITLATIGTIATWTLSGALSVLATICTLIVVGPKAWEQVALWWKKYGPSKRGPVDEV